MATKILHKKSATPDNVPSTGQLDFGELALNYADGKIYYLVLGGGSVDRIGPKVVDDLDDFDNTTTAPVRNQVAKWNGSEYVPGDLNDSTEFTFLINTLLSPEISENSVTLIRPSSVEWLAADSDYITTWQNAIITSGDVTAADTNGTLVTGFPLALSTFTSPETVNLAGAIDYPADEWASGSCFIKFTATVSDGVDSPTKIFYQYFRNKMLWGLHETTTGLTDAEYLAMTGGSNAFVTTSKNLSSKTITTDGTYKRLHVLWPSRISGTPTFWIGGFDETDAFTLDATDNFENDPTDGYTETYKKYVSDNAFSDTEAASFSFEIT